MRDLKTLVKKELKATAEEFGDERRSPLNERGEAQAFNEKDLMTAEPITAVLSDKGWLRAAKGHEIDPGSLSYKSGDKFLSAAKGKSNQNVFLQDTTGRYYALPGHTLPSARGQGEPATGRLKIAPGRTVYRCADGSRRAENSAGHRCGLWVYWHHWRSVHQEQSR